MSNPVDDIGANGGDEGAGRFWDLYGTAGSPRTRSRAEPPPEAPLPPFGEQPPDPGDRGQAPDHGETHAADPQNGHPCLEWCPICRGAEVLRSGGAPEIRGQLQAVQRDSLLMLRALIDSYLQRPPAEPPRDGGGVEDIPIG